VRNNVTLCFPPRVPSPELAPNFSLGASNDTRAPSGRAPFSIHVATVPLCVRGHKNVFPFPERDFPNFIHERILPPPPPGLTETPASPSLPITLYFCTKENISCVLLSVCGPNSQSWRLRQKINLQSRLALTVRVPSLPSPLPPLSQFDTLLFQD